MGMGLKIAFGYGVKMHLWMEQISRWNRSPDGANLQSGTPGQGVGQQGGLGSVLWHPLSPSMPDGGDGTRAGDS